MWFRRSSRVGDARRRCGQRDQTEEACPCGVHAVGARLEGDAAAVEVATEGLASEDRLVGHHAVEIEGAFDELFDPRQVNGLLGFSLELRDLGRGVASARSSFEPRRDGW